MIIIHNVVQKTVGWHRLRWGKVTGTAMKKLMAGGPVAQKNLFQRLREEHANPFDNRGYPDDHVVQEGYIPALAWGNNSEPKALSNFELDHGQKLVRSRVLENNDYPLFLVSLDAEMVDGTPVEVKCPFNQRIHLDCYEFGMPDEHFHQCQAAMMATGKDQCKFMSFDPRVDWTTGKATFYYTVERDQEYIDEAHRRLTVLEEALKTGEFTPFDVRNKTQMDLDLNQVPQLF